MPSQQYSWIIPLSHSVEIKEKKYIDVMANSTSLNCQQLEGQKILSLG